ncbi:AAA family ATPase, partial [bacterium]|nr:AAA family ATPase [bacterium]MBU1024712.1 AAA family ATPase [bacterium]
NQNINHKIQMDELNTDFLNCLGLEEDAQARYLKLKYQYGMEAEKIQSEESGEEKTRKQVEQKRRKLIDAREKAASGSVQIEELDSRRETQSVRIARMETELVSYLKEVADIAIVKGEYPDLLDTESEDFNRFLESEYIDNLPSRKQLVDELEVINSKIEEIGEVNVLAERDYENYLRRRDFLQNQQSDLVKAADELMETLGEIEGESKKSFKEIFAQTKVNFEEIFTELFPNGNAQLTLTDLDNILDSGLEIKVKFPGKKELDLLQLSGGERSIIAIAFLFAVLKTKPPSFVILDEVEAALDDVNVEKFIRLMKGFSDKFQFIIVTHNKLTMEYARELWGVTLKKGGMSQVVNISLEDWVTEHPETVQ